MPIESTTTFTVQEEPFDTVIADAMAIFNTTRSDPVEVRRFEWLYRENPDGEAVIWTVRHAKTGAVVGFTACLPRRMFFNGESRIAWNCADFSIRRDSRSLGPAVKLRRAAKLGIDAGRMDFLYAHPNARMEKVHTRVKHRPIGKMIRLAKPLQLSHYLGERLKSTLVRRVARHTIDPVLSLVNRVPRGRSRYEVFREVNVSFDTRYDDLVERYRTVSRFIGVRDSRYLNWRYTANPLYETHAFVARTGGELAGYLLYMVEANLIHVKDVFPPDPAVAVELFRALIGYDHTCDVTGLSFSLLEDHPMLPVLESLGFRRRADASWMYGYVPNDADLACAFYSPTNWLISVGDRDV